VAHIWAISVEANQLIKIDPSRREPVGRLSVGAGPCALAATADTVWVVAYEDEALVRVDANRLEITARIALPHSPNTLGLDEHGVWVGLQMGQPEAGLAYVDAASNQVRIYPDRGWPAGRVGSEFWLDQPRSFDNSALVAIDPATGQTVDRFEAWNIAGFAIDGDTVWITHQAHGRTSSVISRLDLRSGDRTEVIAVPDYAMNLMIMDRDLWFSTYMDPGLLGRLDTETQQLTTFEIPFITDMAALGAEIWMCTQPRGDTYLLPETRVLCFDAHAGKLATGIECRVPLYKIAIA
jgi:streptogramin lyase